MSTFLTRDRSVCLQPVSQLAARTLDWLWPGRLALGKLAMLDGDPGMGTSLLALDLCARLSTGRPFPDGSPGAGPVSSIVVNGEDGAEDTIRPRLQALGADLERVFVLNRTVRGARDSLRFPAQARVLDRALERTGARLVVLDPVMAFLEAAVATGSDTSVLRALDPLLRLVEEHRCVVQVVRHLNKSGGIQAIYRGGGSVGIIGACRSSRCDRQRLRKRDKLGRAPIGAAKNWSGISPGRWRIHRQPRGVGSRRRPAEAILQLRIFAIIACFAPRHPALSPREGGKGRVRRDGPLPPGPGAIMVSALIPRIHPTAVIAADAELADDVQVGPYVIIEGRVRVGSGCIVRPHAYLCGPLSMGCRNVVFTGAVLGERPQHLHYKDEPTSLEIGDENIFREHVTVHRGTAHTGKTQIGSRNFFMAGSHIAHDCRIGNGCILANGALVGGHCAIEDGVYLSGNCAIHQFVRVGRLALLSGCSATTKDIPPFIMQQGINCVVGINVIGMRRAGMTHAQINAIRHAFHVLYRQGQTVNSALDQLERELGGIDAVAEMITFIRQSTRGISVADEHSRSAAA